MADLVNRIEGQRSGFENLMLHIPGFRGYKNATDRRNADRMVRDHVVAQLKAQLNRLAEVEKKIITAGGLADAGKTRDAKAKLQLFIDHVNTSAPGYAGFYDAQKIGDAELEKIYNFDVALIAFVDKFKTAIDALDKAAADKDALPGAISGLDAVGSEANDTYSQRENVLKDVK